MTMATRVMDTHRVVADVGMAAVAIEEEDSVDVAVAMADADVLTTPLVGMSRIKRLEKVTQRKSPKVLPTTLLLLCKLVMAASAVVDFAEEEAVVAVVRLPAAFKLRTRLPPCPGCARRRATIVEGMPASHRKPLRVKADSPTREEPCLCEIEAHCQETNEKKQKKKEKIIY
jgi:hypothetical protein